MSMIHWTDGRASGGRFFIAIASATILSLIALGFFLHRGALGLYMDDYSLKAWAFDFNAMKWKCTLVPLDQSWAMRPLTLLLEPNLANAIPRYGLFIRIAIAIMQLLNVWLLAKLAYRLSRSTLVSVISGAIFLFPVGGNQGVLWFTSAVSDTLSLFFLLLGFHFLLSCDSYRDRRLLVSGIVAWLVMVMFYESGVFVIFLVPALFALTEQETRRTRPKMWITALTGSFVPIAIYLRFIESKSADVIARGGTTLDPRVILTHKIPEVSKELWWLITDWGILGPFKEAFGLGWREWREAPLGQLLLAGALIGVCASVLFFRPEFEIRSSARLIGIIGIGMGWIVLSLIPIVLIRGQIVEIRTLYIPSAGFALSAGALGALVVNLSGPWRSVSTRTILAFTGLGVFLASITMAGLVYTYQLRWDLDQRQVEALSPVIRMLPRDELVWLLPVKLDEKTIATNQASEAKLNMYLDGVFENSWSARDAVRLRYGDRNIQAVTANRWVGMHLTALRADGGRSGTITVEGADIPIEHLLAFTYRQGQAILLNPIEITDANRHSSTVLDLPLIGRLAASGLQIEEAHFQLEHQD